MATRSTRGNVGGPPPSNLRWRQRPPPTNPNYRDRDQQQKEQPQPPKQRQPRQQQQRQILALLSSMVMFGVWYLTPVSEWVVTVLLWQIPIESDLDLGREAFQTLPWKDTTDRWGVQQVGWDLVDHHRQQRQKKRQNNNNYDYYHDNRDNLDSYEFSWDFGVVHAPGVVNAFALPGGIVRVTDTLLNTLDLTQGELAALIGHEMGHVVHRHSQARLVEQQLLSLVARALVYEDYDDKRETFGEAMSELLLKSARFLGKQAFSRRDEYEADATSWDLLALSRAYNPKSLESLLTKLWKMQGGRGGDTSWESTHPGTKDRIAALEEKWKDLDPRERRQLSSFAI